MQNSEIITQLKDILAYLKNEAKNNPKLLFHSHIQGDSNNTSQIVVICNAGTTRPPKNAFKEREMSSFLDECIRKGIPINPREKRFPNFIGHFVVEAPKYQKSQAEVYDYVKQITAGAMLNRCVNGNMVYTHHDENNPDCTISVTNQEGIWTCMIEMLRMKESGLIFTIEQQLQEKMQELEGGVRPPITPTVKAPPATLVPLPTQPTTSLKAPQVTIPVASSVEYPQTPTQVSSSVPEQAAPSSISPDTSSSSKPAKISTFSAIFAPGGYQSYLAKNMAEQKAELEKRVTEMNGQIQDLTANTKKLELQLKSTEEEKNNRGKMIEGIKLEELKTKEAHQKALEELYWEKEKISAESNEKFSKLDKDIKEKESNVSNLTLKLEATTMERDTITKQLNDLKSEKQNTDTTNQSQIEDLKNEITQFQGKVGQLGQERANALQEIQIMQKRATELERSLKSLETEKNTAISALEKKNTELHTNLNQINANFEANKKEWEKYAVDATTAYNQMINQKDSAINGIKSNLLKSEETVKSLTSEKEKLASQMDKKIVEIQNQLEKITYEKGTIQKQIEQERVEGQKKLNQAEKEIQKLSSEIENIQKQGEKTGTEIQVKLTQAINEIQRLTSEKEDIIKQQNIEKAEIQEKLAQAEKEIQKLLSEKGEPQKDTDQDLATLTAKIEKLTSEKETIVKKFQEKLKIIADHESTIRDTSEKLAQKEHELKFLKQQINSNKPTPPLPVPAEIIPDSKEEDFVEEEATEKESGEEISGETAVPRKKTTKRTKKSTTK